MSIYLDRYAYQPLAIEIQPHTNTGLIVVIPVYKEPDIIPTLESLKDCALPDTHTEVLIIINEPEHCDNSIRELNAKTYSIAKTWIDKNSVNGISFYVSKITLPRKNAGVGLARKAGMDEAVRRFETIGNEEGIILCYDSDCTCAPTYLKNIYHTFKEKDLFGASIHFEHPTENLSALEKEGIEQYELHLRYYVNALRNAGYPYAFHTIGSSMAVRSDIYKKAGGMNKRKAGEDFHFLHKIIPYGNFDEITTTTVYPEARISDRVPFGTGKAMNEWINTSKQHFLSYHPEIFKHIKFLLKQVPNYYKSKSVEDKIKDLHPTVLEYLIQENFIEAVEEINKQSRTPETYLHRWFLWFNGLKALHLVHYLRDHTYPSIPVIEAASQLLELESTSPEILLNRYRELDKSFTAEKISLKHLYSGFL